MTRRGFMKSLAAIAGGVAIAQLPDFVVAESEVAETPITRDDPLAWLWLDDERFAILDSVIDEYGESPMMDYHGNVISPAGEWGWSAECTLDGYGDGRLSQFLLSNRAIDMVIEVPSRDKSFAGQVRMSAMTTSVKANGDATTSVLLWGIGPLGQTYKT